MIDLFIQYLPEIIMVLSILAPMLPTIIIKIMSDTRTRALLDTFKVEQGNLRMSATAYKADVERLTLELQRLDQMKKDLSLLATDIELIGRQLGIKPRVKEE